MRLRIDASFKNLKVNRLIRCFIISDFLFFSGWGLISPIFAIFVIQQIPGADLITVGTVAAVYWVIKALFQIPVSIYLDRHAGERDDFYALVAALMLAGFTSLAFLLTRTTVQLYTVVLLQGIAFGLYTPAWSAMFARHLDREHYSFDWSLDSTAVGLAAGITGFIGGALATGLGFTAVFIGASILSFASALALLAVPNLLFPRVAAGGPPLIRDHTPTNVQR